LTLKIKNSEIEGLVLFLLDFKLKGKENRMRNKFIKYLQLHLEDVRDDHKELLNEYCKKDEKGNLITLKEDDKEYYDIDDVKGFQKDYEELLNEYCVIPNDESFAETNTTVKKIVLNCEKEFSGAEALTYESYCDMFEKPFQHELV
jgi:hypothetical protein